MSAYSEAELFSHFDSDFEQLDHALHDPYITDAVNEAKMLNELMRTEPTSVEDARNIVGTLDTMWHAILQGLVTVTGNVSFLTPDGEPRTDYYEDVEMISNGFIISGDSQDEGSQVGRVISLGFSMEIPEDQKAAYEVVTDGTHLVGQAALDQVEIQVHGYSPERAKAWLATYAAELIDEIDYIILNAHGSVEDSLLALRNVAIPQIAGDDNTREIAYECLGVYLHSVLRLDMKLPYITEIKGRIIIKNEVGEDVFGIPSEVTRLVYIHDILVLEMAEFDIETGDMSGGEAKIYLQATILNKDADGDDLHARVPIESLTSLESVRQLM